MDTHCDVHVQRAVPVRKLLKTAHHLYCGGVACHDTESVSAAVGLAEASPRPGEPSKYPRRLATYV